MRGVQVDELNDALRQQLGLKPDTRGVVITEVADGSPASDAGLQRGDVIEQVNRQPVSNVADYQRLIAQAGKQAVILLINRGGNTTFLAVQPE
jgi:serine protease Do